MTMYRNPVIHGQAGHINRQLNSMNHMLALVTLDYDKKCDDRLTTDLKAHTKKPFMLIQFHKSQITCLIPQCPLMVRQGNTSNTITFQHKSQKETISINYNEWNIKFFYFIKFMS